MGNAAACPSQSISKKHYLLFLLSDARFNPRPFLYPLVNFCILQHAMHRVIVYTPKHIGCYLLIRIEKKDKIKLPHHSKHVDCV